MAEYWLGRTTGAALLWYEFNEAPLKWLLSSANVLRNDGSKQGFTLLAEPKTRENIGKRICEIANGNKREKLKAEPL